MHFYFRPPFFSLVRYPRVESVCCTSGPILLHKCTIITQMRDRARCEGHQVASAPCLPLPSLPCHLPSRRAEQGDKAEEATATSNRSTTIDMAMARSVGGSSVQYSRNGVSVITKCARLSISSSIMLAHQASSRPGGGASSRGQSTPPARELFHFLMGTEGYVPMYPRTQSPPAHLIPHLALGSSTTTRPDRRRAHPRNRYVPGAAVRGYMVPPPSRTHTAAQAGCVTAMFPAHRPRVALGKYFCLVPGPVKSRPCRDHAVTAVQTPEVPLTLVPGLRRPPTVDALPPASLASHLRQGMAGHGRALTDRLAPLQHAFWPSFCRNGQSWNRLPRSAHHGHNYKCPPSLLSQHTLSLCSIIRPNIIETIQLFLPHSF